MSKYTCYYCGGEYNAENLELVEVEADGERVIACEACRGAA